MFLNFSGFKSCVVNSNSIDGPVKGIITPTDLTKNSAYRHIINAGRISKPFICLPFKIAVNVKDVIVIRVMSNRYMIPYPPLKVSNWY